MYATRTDMSELYGDDLIARVSTRYGEEVSNEAAIEKALADASGLIDTHIGVRYPLPLSAPAPVLRRPCVDVAIYYLAQSADVLTEQIEMRYKDAKSLLGKLSRGEAKLTQDSDGDGNSESSARVVTVEGPARQFSRDKLRGL